MSNRFNSLKAATRALEQIKQACMKRAEQARKELEQKSQKAGEKKKKEPRPITHIELYLDKMPGLVELDTFFDALSGSGVKAIKLHLKGACLDINTDAVSLEDLCQRFKTSGVETTLSELDLDKMPGEDRIEGFSHALTHLNVEKIALRLKEFCLDENAESVAMESFCNALAKASVQTLVLELTELSLKNDQELYQQFDIICQKLGINIDIKCPRLRLAVALKQVKWNHSTQITVADIESTLTKLESKKACYKQELKSNVDINAEEALLGGDRTLVENSNVGDINTRKMLASVDPGDYFKPSNAIDLYAKYFFEAFVALAKACKSKDGNSLYDFWKKNHAQSNFMITRAKRVRGDCEIRIALSGNLIEMAEVGSDRFLLIACAKLAACQLRRHYKHYFIVKMHTQPTPDEYSDFIKKARVKMGLLDKSLAESIERRQVNKFRKVCSEKVIILNMINHILDSQDGYMEIYAGNFHFNEAEGIGESQDSLELSTGDTVYKRKPCPQCQENKSVELKILEAVNSDARDVRQVVATGKDGQRTLICAPSEISDTVISSKQVQLIDSIGTIFSGGGSEQTTFTRSELDLQGDRLQGLYDDALLQDNVCDGAVADNWDDPKMRKDEQGVHLTDTERSLIIGLINNHQNRESALEAFNFARKWLDKRLSWFHISLIYAKSDPLIVACALEHMDRLGLLTWMNNENEVGPTRYFYQVMDHKEPEKATNVLACLHENELLKRSIDLGGGSIDIFRDILMSSRLEELCTGVVILAKAGLLDDTVEVAGKELHLYSILKNATDPTMAAKILVKLIPLNLSKEDIDLVYPFVIDSSTYTLAKLEKIFPFNEENILRSIREQELDRVAKKLSCTHCREEPVLQRSPASNLDRFFKNNKKDSENLVYIGQRHRLS